MLKSITLNNYTTFINKTTFDFKATNYKILEDTNVGNDRILKGALFVGENASGKTETIKAIKLLLDLLFVNDEINVIMKKSMYTKGTTFSLSYSFDINSNDITYSIEFDKDSISCEKLYLNNNVLIERIGENGRTYFNNEEKKVNNINSHLLLLKQEYYNTRFYNDSILNKWFDYLKNSIYINCYDRNVISYNQARKSEQLILYYIEKNDVKKINSFLNKLGYNSEVVLDNNFINNSYRISTREKVIGIKKRGTSFTMPLPLDSTGNNVLMNVLLPFHFATNNDCMLLVDEFSSGFHNELEEALIKYFFNNSKNSQIFFMSHSTNLLDTYLLRPDQIYSFRFDTKKGTIIKRFSDENPRESQNLEKMYLSGVFDGRPEYNKELKN